MKLLGYVAHNMTLDLSASKTCRLRNATDERLRELLSQNLKDLRRIINWNIEQNILFYRITSNLVPYATHPGNKLDWAGEFKDEFALIGRLIRDSGMLVSMHPGQYTVLSSPDSDIAARGLAEIEYHARVLALLGAGLEAKINVHLGGVYDNKKAAMLRWERRFSRLTHGARRRLTIENDGVNYGVDDCLAVHRAAGVPVVFDTHHFHRQENAGGDPGGEIAALEKCLATWRGQLVKPEIHFASQDPLKTRLAHAPTIDLDQFFEFYRRTEDLEFNIMLETKDKELSLLRIRRELVRRL